MSELNGPPGPPREATVFAVRQDDIRTTTLLQKRFAGPDGDRPRTLLRVDQFALTSNTITYAARAEVMSSFRFFPVDEPGWGCIPAWGFSTVVESTVDGIAVGERYFGYVPMASHFLVEPASVTPSAFMDAAPHRPPRIPIYNRYARSAEDPLYSAENAAALAVFRPLFMTSFLLAEFLKDARFFGAKQVIFSSASSKTAYGAAAVLHDARALGGVAVDIVGLTAEKNVAFVRSLGVYDRVVEYADIGALPDGAAALVDLAGNPAVRGALRRRFGKELVHDCTVGGTHWDRRDGHGDVTTDAAFAAPKPFLAATQIEKHSADWGAFQSKVAAGLQAFIARATRGNEPWIRFVQASGGEDVTRAYALVVSGGASPRDGYILTL